MHPWNRDHWLPGVLSKEQLEQLINESYILGVRDFKAAADYSSINLYLANEGYQMLQGSIKPCGKPYRTFLKKRKFAKPLKPDDKGCFRLKRNECYVFKLREKLSHKLIRSNIIHGQATAKSSIGRLDVIARLIVDGMHQYESMRPDVLKKENSSGEMFLEIIPISFHVCVKEGISLSQLRLFYGKPEDSEINDETFIKGILLGSEDGKGFLSVEISNISIGGLKVVAFGAVISGDIEDDYIDLWKKRVENQKQIPANIGAFIN